MSDRPNRRKNHFFGMTFDISVKWLVVIIVMGLVQFGVFWKDFGEVKVKLSEVVIYTATIAANLNSINNATLVKDAQQDGRISELERRMNARDARNDGGSP